MDVPQFIGHYLFPLDPCILFVARVFILSKGKERKRKKEENLSACSEFKEYARGDVHRSTPSGEASAPVRVCQS